MQVLCAPVLLPLLLLSTPQAYARPLHKNKPPLRIAVLQTYARPYQLSNLYGTVPQNFVDWLQSEFTVQQPPRVYHCYQDHIPSLDEVNKVDLIIIPGSFISVNNNYGWVGKLAELLVGRRRKPWALGVCFGHHLTAKAFGGVVKEHPRGWESGAHAVNLNCSALPAGIKPTWTVLESHKQHITVVPEELTVWAWNDFAPVQGLLSRERRILTSQFHPDYTKEYFIGTAHLRQATAEQIERVRAANLDHGDMACMLRQLLCEDG